MCKSWNKIWSSYTQNGGKINSPIFAFPPSILCEITKFVGRIISSNIRLNYLNNHLSESEDRKLIQIKIKTEKEKHCLRTANQDITYQKYTNEIEILYLNYEKNKLKILPTSEGTEKDTIYMERSLWWPTQSMTLWRTLPTLHSSSTVGHWWCQINWPMILHNNSRVHYS